MIIRQVYIPYWKWEDFINGMWGNSLNEENDLKVAIEFTGDHIKYGSAMSEVIVAWPNTMLNSLTNKSLNRRAFLGHCAVCYKLKIPEYITRAAWKELTDQQRFDADKMAQQILDQWMKDYVERNKSIHSIMGTQMLF